MRPSGPEVQHGDILTAISDGLVALLKEFYGRGPSQVKSYYYDDLVVCILRGGYTRVEETLRDGGRGAAVMAQRMEFQELMRRRFEQVIQDATGRPVVGFMSGNQQEPDMMCEVFVLGPSDILEPADQAVGDPSALDVEGRRRLMRPAEPVGGPSGVVVRRGVDNRGPTA